MMSPQLKYYYRRKAADPEWYQAKLKRHREQRAKRLADPAQRAEHNRKQRIYAAAHREAIRKAEELH